MKKKPFDKDAYEKAKNGKLKLNWIIPEMGLSAGGHINIFRFVTMLQNAGFQNRIYVINPIAFHSSEECRAFLSFSLSRGFITRETKKGFPLRFQYY